MINPILQMLGNNNTNTFVKAFQTMRNAKNPMDAMTQYIQNSPEGQQAMAYVQQNGGSAKDAFYRLAQQQGVDPESILAMLR